MSIDLNWETVTAGSDGQELANKVRDFIHAKFQSVPLPRFIKSVTVHEFEFGTIPPQIELKDMTDPLPDFYEDNSEIGTDDDDTDGDGADGEDTPDMPADLKAAIERKKRAEAAAAVTRSKAAHLLPHVNTAGNRASLHLQDLGSPYLGVSTPGIPGGTSTLHYFHSQFANGTHTPLAAMAGAQHLGGSRFDGVLEHSSSAPVPHQQFVRAYKAPFPDQSHRHGRHPSQSSISASNSSPTQSWSGHGSTGAGLDRNSSGGIPSALREKDSVSTLAPTSTGGASRPPTRDASADDEQVAGVDRNLGDRQRRQQKRQQKRERRADDIQAVFRIRYAGNIKLLLTTDILLDYPMPSFVGIPVKLSITGLAFDGVGVLAYIRRRMHLCFLSPEDALAALGTDGGGIDTSAVTDTSSASSSLAGKKWGLLQKIRVESEIGQREGGGQTLKNVGKVERFVLEQVRRIFEDEFVYPNFWTFLV